MKKPQVSIGYWTCKVYGEGKVRQATATPPGHIFIQHATWHNGELQVSTGARVPNAVVLWLLRVNE